MKRNHTNPHGYHPGQFFLSPRLYQQRLLNGCEDYFRNQEYYNGLVPD